MTIAITGSNGFIGSKLKKELVKLDIEIIELSKESGFDILDFKKIINVPKFDLLIHLAAKLYVPDSYSTPLVFFQNNIIGTLNSLDLCRIHNAGFIYFSSYVYGQPEYLPIDEEHRVSYWNPYASSKLVGEKLCETYHFNFNLNCLILRLFNIYGEGQSDKFLIPTIISGIKNNNLKLDSLESRRDYLYIDDLINLLIKIVHTPFTYDIFNVGSGKSYSINELINTINNILGKSIEPLSNEIKRPNEIVETVAKIDKISTYYNWKPDTDIYDGLRKIIL